jgi:hypothetical protein
LELDTFILAVTAHLVALNNYYYFIMNNRFNEQAVYEAVAAITTKINSLSKQDLGKLICT